MKNILILGDQGSGKTTKLKQLLAEHPTHLSLDEAVTADQVCWFLDAAKADNTHCIIASQLRVKDFPLEVLAHFDIYRCEYSPIMKSAVVLAQDYAKVNLNGSSIIEAAFLAGYDAAKNEWIPFEEGTKVYFNTLKDPMLLFDNGEICRYNEPHPIAIMTHFFPLPNIPTT